MSEETTTIDTEEAPEQRSVRNQAKCLGCGDVIVSRNRHDYVTCSCGSLSVDGGLSYTKRNFDPAVGWEELSLFSSEPPEDGHQLEHSEVVLEHTHPKGACYGEHCTLHEMSDHPLRKYEQVWTEGRMWRKCEHGNLHPDPDEFGLGPDSMGHRCCEEHCCKGAYGASDGARAAKRAAGDAVVTARGGAPGA